MIFVRLTAPFDKLRAGSEACPFQDNDFSSLWFLFLLFVRVSAHALGISSHVRKSGMGHPA
jgi:hypothetical protein